MALPTCNCNVWGTIFNFLKSYYQALIFGSRGGLYRYEGGILIKGRDYGGEHEGYFSTRQGRKESERSQGKEVDQGSEPCSLEVQKGNTEPGR